MAARALTLWKQFQTDYATRLYWPAGLLALGDVRGQGVFQGAEQSQGSLPMLQRRQRPKVTKRL